MPLTLSHRKLQSFSPDVDSVTPGIILDGNDFVPSMQGFRTLPDLFQATESLQEQCRGAAALTFQDGTQWIVAGTENTLNAVLAQDLNGNAPAQWHTQYLPASTPKTRHWYFAMYQDIIIAVDGSRKPYVATQASLNVGVWNFLGGSPPVLALVGTSDFSLFGVEAQNDGEPSAKWWSTLNPTIWTPDIATECVTSTLSQTNGGITALKALRSMMVLYKNQSTFIGQLVGPPFIWQFTEVSRQSGAVSQDGVVSVQDGHWLIGPDDAYILDGFSLPRAPNALREWFFDRVDDFGLTNVKGRFDQPRSLAFWHYPVNGTQDATVADEWICANARTGQWATGQLRVQAVVQQLINYDLGGYSTSGLFRDDAALYLYAPNGQRTTNGAFLTTGDVGDRHYMYQVTRARPGFTIVNGTPVLTPLSTYTPGGAYTAGAPVPLSADGWFNMVNTARLQRMRLSADADVEIADLELQVQPVGDV
jgi:hypothetical protein